MIRFLKALAPLALLLSFGAHAQSCLVLGHVPTVAGLPICVGPSGPTPPAIAHAVGYNTRTYNSTTIGTTSGVSLFDNCNFYGTGNTTGTQNGDGSVTVGGPSIDPQLCTAKQNSSFAGDYQGIVFGCGFYAQAKMQWTAPSSVGSSWPAFWAFDIETIAPATINANNIWGSGTNPLQATFTSGSANIALNFNPEPVYVNQTSVVKWGKPIIEFTGSLSSITGISLNTPYCVLSATTTTVQITTYTGSGTSGTCGTSAITLGGTGTANTGLSFGNYFEADWMEADNRINPSTAVVFPSALHNWGSQPDSSYQSQSPTFSTNFNYTPNVQHTWAALWVPATGSTPSTQGYMKVYYDGIQEGESDWYLYNPANKPPNTGTAIGAVVDTRHLAIFVNGATAAPVKLSDLEVWQGSGACNIVH